MQKVLITLGAVVAFGAASVPLDPAAAHERRHRAYQRAHDACGERRQAAGRNGTIIGALGGAVVGSTVAARGAKTEGAAVGGVAGGLLGHQIAKKDHRYGRR